jgi:hypothetical protein
VAAPKLSFSEREKKKRETRRGPGPPPPVRNPKKHSFLSNVWAGIESMPRGVYEQEEELRHAIGKDIESSQGLAGLASYPWALAIDASLAPFSEKRLKELRRQAAAPWTNRKKGNVLSPVLVRMGKEGYESTRQATGTRGTKKFKEIWHDNPIAALGSVAVVGGPVSRAVGGASMAAKIAKANRVPLKGGGTRAMTKTEALKAAAVESYYPGMLDKLGIEGSPFKPRVSGRRVSRSPYGRASQKAFDFVSEKIDTGAIPKLGPNTPLSSTRRAAAGARRADDLQRGRLVTNAMRHVSTFADYLNDTTLSRVGTALGRRKETLTSRDAAVGAALHASSSVDPVEAVRLAAEDTKSILQSGKRSAHQGDIGDVEPAKRVGQTVYVTHGIDEDGAPIREQATVTADHGDRVTVMTEAGDQVQTKTIPHGRAHLVGPNGEGEIPLSADEIKMLERRYDHLTEAHAELLSEPRLQEKFRAATQSMTDLGQMNEQIGIDYFTRGLDPTGSEALAIRERLTSRRNQFLDRLGGEGADAIDYDEGLWGDLQRALEKSGKYTDEQQFVFLSVLDRQARLWANEVEGRHPSEYLASPEGARIGGIDYSKPEDLEATVNAMFQTAGERRHLVKTQTTVLVSARPVVGDLVSTPKGMGVIHSIQEFGTTGERHNPENARVVVEMNEGPSVTTEWVMGDLRLSQHPWVGHPQPDDYVMTPDGPGRVEHVSEGPGPDFVTDYIVTLFEDVNGMFVDGEERFYKTGQVQRIDDPHDQGGAIFHLASQQALGGEKFPKKATAEQYRKAFETAQVKPDEFYWMGLSRRPMLEVDLATAETALAAFEKRVAEDPELMETILREDHKIPANTIEEQRAMLRRDLDLAQERVEEYPDNPDPNMLLDAHWGGKSFPVQAIQDAVDARAHFLDIKETLFSSDADYSYRDKWGNNGEYGNGEGSGLIIRDPTSDQPYKELVLELPQSDLFNAGHWTSYGITNPVVHIRFHEIVDNEGRKTILIDEIQSDWNLRGRQFGWREILTPFDERQVARLRDKERRLRDIFVKLETELGFGRHDIDNWYDRLIREAMNEMNVEIAARNDARRLAREEQGYSDAPTPEDPDEPRIFGYGRDREVIEDRIREDHADDPVFDELLKVRDRFVRLEEKMRETRQAADSIETGAGRASAINKGPLVMGDTSKYLAMKRMIRWAADHGQTRIIWGRGHEQGVRYSLINDLPLSGRSRGEDLDPSNYDNDFYYPHGSEIIDNGGFYQSMGGDGLSEAVKAAMRNSSPVEVRHDNGILDEDYLGDEYVLIPAESLKEAPNMTGQLTLPEGELPSPFDPQGNPSHFPRFGKIISDDGEAMLVRPLDPDWDPARFTVSYRGDTGESSWSSYDVQIISRSGESIFNETLDGEIGTDLSTVIGEMAETWERRIRSRYMEGGDAVPANVAAKDAEIAKMHETLNVLADAPWVEQEFSRMINNVDYELDETRWEEYVEEYRAENGGGEGDFEEIRDHDPSISRRVRKLKDELTDLQETRERDIERGHSTVEEYDRLISNQKIAIWRAEQGVEWKAHIGGYDQMMPLVAEKLLKPYRKESDYAKVGLKQKIYRGRYGSEGQGVLSDEGDMHGWTMELPEKMLKDARGDTYPLFQKGNDIIKGASTWVGGPDGQRFIALTEHADFSTLMHEFIGHATEEMARRYPELWEAVERDMKKPLSEWKTAEHEKFAKWVERYWMEGKAPSPELATVMKMIKEWMRAVYTSITQLGRPMPESTRVLLNRHLGAGITARPGARSYVPHVSQFDTMMDSAPGGTRLAAGGNVVGVPQVDRRNFGARRNRGILWQSGELALSARPIIDQYFRRTKFMETEAVRQEMFDGGHPVPKNGRPPEGAWLVRNPEAAPERLTARNKSKLSEEDFSRMIGEGDTPEEFVTKMEEIRKDHYAAPGEHPAWANDLENTRWVEAGKINARIQNVFPTAPRGRVAASAGSVNSMARLAGIYLRPLHYLVGNIPQNVMLVALTNPSALINSAKYGAYSFLPRVIREMGVQPRDLFAHDRHLYNQIKTETGDIQAGAGLPDFYTQANNRFQKGERRLNKVSQGTAEKLGELADQPYRVSVWIAHAKKYGYNTPDEWRSLLDSERGTPEARIRDDIAQQTREDMIDFNTLSPGERQNISRFFYLWAFTRGFAKWPVTFAREYPGRTGAAMMLADPERRDDMGVPISALPATGVMKSKKGPGKVRDLGFLDPTQGLRQQIETGIQVAHGNFQGVGGMTTPPLETGLQAITGGPRAPKGGLGGLAEQLARDTVPFWDIGRKATTPGISVSERVKRVLDFTDRFGVKEEIGKGKNAEKKRKEDEKIRRVLTEAERLDVLPQVMHQQDAYWHHKYMEQQIRFGAQARRKGTALTDEEKLTILYATAADYYPEAELPPLTEILAGPADLQEKYRTELRDSMFGLRNEAVK